MLARSVRNPLVIGLGTGVILVLSTAPPVLAAAGDSASPSPSASPSGSPTPVPEIHVEFARTSTSAVHAGNTVSLTAHVHTGTLPADDVKLSLGADRGASISARCTLSAGLCKLGAVDSKGETVTFTVTVPSKVTSGNITVSGYAFDPNGDDSGVVPFHIKVTKAPSPKPSKSATHNSHSSGSGSSSESSGSSGTSNNPTPPGDLNSGASGPAPSVAPANNTVLPGINQQNQGQTPSTVPLMQTAGNAQSMSGSADGPDELTFDKLASTQAAWLAALLVAFSLLLTQVRLGKANARAARPAKPKGAHRRTRRRRRPGSRAL